MLPHPEYSLLFHLLPRKICKDSNPNPGTYTPNLTLEFSVSLQKLKKLRESPLHTCLQLNLYSPLVIFSLLMPTSRSPCTLSVDR